MKVFTTKVCQSGKMGLKTTIPTDVMKELSLTVGESLVWRIDHEGHSKTRITIEKVK